MQPVAAATTWTIPAIVSSGALADWLGLQPSELDWFADLKGLTRQRLDGRLRHYHYRILAKQFGAVRLIEAPKRRLKGMQRQILSEILERVPAHSAVHGFVRGRSIATFATPHVGRHVVLRMDLTDFFPSFRAARIAALFRTLGYPETVAGLLTGICTNAAPTDLWKTGGAGVACGLLRQARELYRRPHLPQGAPTSPALANLCAYQMDCRLNALAAASGAIYTRYADDLAFSGDAEFARSVERFALHTVAALTAEGFTVHHRKTRIMRQGVRQYLAGLVVNQRLNVVRDDFDRLKATLTNCVRQGPAEQNRDQHPDFRTHLLGHIAFVASVNPGRGLQLRRIFEHISW